MNGLKKLAWMLLAVCLPWCFSACSDDDTPKREMEIVKPDKGGKEPYQDVRAYANFFSYNV